MDKKDVLRGRGWSIQSEGTTQSSVTREEKIALLESMPTGIDNHDEDDDRKPSARQNCSSTDAAREGSKEQGDGDDVKGGEKIVSLAKSRLSKWASRLFDPNRPRGLIQPPQTIPLNDEFLQAFGKREKADDKALGRTLEIDSKIESDDEDATVVKPSKESKDRLAKVKIANLKFTTTKEVLEAACSKFGVIESVKVIMDEETKSATPLNRGIAYVTFQGDEAAKACMENFTELDGRRLRISLAADASSTRGGSSQPVRYWLQDITTKCYRCGQIGHMANACTNEEEKKPCPICCSTAHEMRMCPNKAVCFNCGVPGHVSRDCKQRRGLPPRRFCAICFQSGHTKLQCRNQRNAFHHGRDAVCMLCGQKGHYMCKSMTWFFGLDGVTCYNCGRVGHIGPECDRPRLENCNRNLDVGRNEIERASTYSTAEEIIRQQSEANQRRDRGRDSKRQDHSQGNRAKSAPAPRDRKRQNELSRGNDSSRGSPKNGKRKRF